MSLNSMTGFARANGEGDGETAGYAWTVEIKSVNARGLDLKLRAPQGIESLDAVLRDACAGKIGRGSLQVSVTLESGQREGGWTINDVALASVLDAVARVRAEIETAPPQPEAILGFRGVMEQNDQRSDAVPESVREGLAATLRGAVDQLAQTRAQEGTRLEATIRAQLEAIGRLANALDASPGAKAPAIKARIEARIAELVSEPVSEERLAQEVALLATKSDIREEIDRLGAHVAQGLELLDEAAPVGRRLDFLAQEFNREANTVCSKASDIEITRLGLALKAVIDQFREQVQNVE